MTSKIIKSDKQTYQVFENNKKLGTIITFFNYFHNSTTYLKLNLNKYPRYFSFQEIRRIENRPLQIMTESNNLQLINFLIRNGFICKRKCYEVKVTRNDLVKNLRKNIKIYYFNNQNSQYKNLCLRLYDYYKTVHADISPLTVSKKIFIKEVPTKTGYFNLDCQNTIENIIFTENNEIAYAVSSNIKSFIPFKNTVLKEMLNKYDDIFFEADDVDGIAMNLLHTFKFNNADSFNTYIYE